MSRTTPGPLPPEHIHINAVRPMKMSSAKIVPHVPVSIDDGDTETGCRAVLKRIRPHWDLDEIRYKVIIAIVLSVARRKQQQTELIAEIVYEVVHRRHHQQADRNLQRLPSGRRRRAGPRLRQEYG